MTIGRNGATGPAILNVAYSLAPVGPDAVGGAEQVLSAMDRALVAAGIRSLVVACRGSVVAGEWIDTGFDPNDVRQDAARQATRAALAGALSRHRVDVIHCHGLDAADVLPPDGPPALITLHLPPDWYPSGLFRTVRSRTWLNAVSAAQHRCCPDADILLPPIDNGVPVAALAGAPHARRSFALTLGRICAEKGQHLALEAAHLAGIPLLIGGAVFGYEAHRVYFRTRVEPRLDRWRRFLGPLDFARKRRLLSAARCLLVPSLAAETSSLVAMEAAACGTPVIAMRVGALPDIVEHGRTGFLVDDVPGMAECLDRVDEIDRATCRAVARERFSLERMTDAYLERYRALA